MEQMSIDPSKIVKIDYESPDYPANVRTLRPSVFIEESDYCCLLGPDPQEGVFGCGSSPEEAIQDWNTHLNERITKPAEDDKLAHEIIDQLNIRKEDVW